MNLPLTRGEAGFDLRIEKEGFHSETLSVAGGRSEKLSVVLHELSGEAPPVAEPEKPQPTESKRKHTPRPTPQAPVAVAEPVAPIVPVAPVPTTPPPAAPAKPKNVAHEPALGEYLSRPTPLIPEAVRAQRKGEEAVFMSVLCVDTTGAVTSVRVLQGIAGADDAIHGALMKWRLKEQPIPICFPVRLIYSFE